MDSINAVKQNKALVAKRFFFPFAPIKTFKSLRLLFLMAILIALKIVLASISIKIAPFGLSISLSWVPIMVIGWYFGPIGGLIGGILTDTLSFVVKGGIWFWMYAIQEPIVGLISGIVGSIYRLRQTKKNKQIILDLIISQIFILGFAVASYFILIKWLNPESHFQGFKPEFIQFYNVYKWIALACILVFVIVFETLFCINVKNKMKQEYKLMLTFVYTSLCAVSIILLFSFALGPLTAIEYFKFMNGSLPSSYLTYGSIFYLVPRVAVESIKTPIELTVLFGVVTLFDKRIINIVNKINCSWNY